MKTFNSMKVKKIIELKEKNVTLAAERSLFGRMLIIAKSRDGLSLKDVMQEENHKFVFALFRY